MYSTSSADTLTWPIMGLDLKTSMRRGPLFPAMTFCLSEKTRTARFAETNHIPLTEKLLDVKLSQLDPLLVDHDHFHTPPRGGVAIRLFLVRHP